jgi:hypothetical protein
MLRGHDPNSETREFSHIGADEKHTFPAVLAPWIPVLGPGLRIFASEEIRYRGIMVR